MIQSKRFWFLRNWQAWLVLIIFLVTAVVARQAWFITLGVIGYLLVLLFEVGLDPRSLVRMLHAEQENRSLRAEHSRLVGGIKELETQVQQLTQELQAARESVRKTSDQGNEAKPTA